MMTIRIIAAAALLALPAAPAFAAAKDIKAPRQVEWSFNGPFGTFDRAQLQRGFQVYKEVCSACHGAGLLSYRNLGEPGGPEFSSEEVKAIAAANLVPAGPDENGEILDEAGMLRTRPATPADRFRYPFANEAAGRAANNGAYPPDLSVMVKGRVDGSNYIYSLLTGYQDPPEGMEMMAGMNYNPYFPGKQIAMPNVLFDGNVTYTDGSPMTADQYAKDVAAFLTWAAEPKMEARKEMGFKVLGFLAVLTALLYLSYRRIWRDQH